MATGPAEREISDRVYRDRLQTVWMIGFVLLYEIAMLALVKRASAYSSVLPVIIGTVMLAGLVLGGRVAWSAVVVADDCICVRNPFSSYRLPWDEIESFRIGRSGILSAVCLIHVKDGRLLHAFGIQERRLATGMASRMVERLNVELSARRTSDPSEA